MSARDDWLEWRRSGVGASDVAAIMCLSNWASPYTVWLDKTRRSVDEDSEALEAGRMLEAAIGPWFTERTGLHVVGEQTWCSGLLDDSWARATVDGFVVESPDSSIDDCLGVFEVKTSSDSPAAWEQDGIPVYYQTQAQWQMFTTRMERLWFAVLHANRGLRLRVYELERDDADITLIVERCRAFWHDYVLTDTPPPVDGHPATVEALKGTRADADAETVDLDADPEVAIAIGNLHRLKASIAALETDRARCENVIRQALGPSTEGRSKLARSITWREQESNRIDTKALRAEMPDVAAKFTNITTARFLRVAPNKET